TQVGAPQPYFRWVGRLQLRASVKRPCICCTIEVNSSSNGLAAASSFRRRKSRDLSTALRHGWQAREAPRRVRVAARLLSRLGRPRMSPRSEAQASAGDARLLVDEFLADVPGDARAKLAALDRFEADITFALERRLLGDVPARLRRDADYTSKNDDMSLDLLLHDLEDLIDAGVDYIDLEKRLLFRRVKKTLRP